MSDYSSITINKLILLSYYIILFITCLLKLGILLVCIYSSITLDYNKK